MAETYENEAPAEVEGSAAERLTFFSDAVVAIALTLLALELPVPEGATQREFWSSAGSHWQDYLAFLISFSVISVHWTIHHRVFRWIRRTDNHLQHLDFYWLLTIVLVPFITKLLAGEAGGGENHTSGLRFALYAALQASAYLVMALMVHHMRSGQLFRPDVPRTLAPRNIRRLGALAAGFAVSVPLFFVTSYAWLLWIIVPPVAGRIARHLARADR